MSKPKLSLEPRKAKAGDGACGAWWYENESSIDVFIQMQPGRTTTFARITRRQIEGWLKKLEAK